MTTASTAPDPAPDATPDPAVLLTRDTDDPAVAVLTLNRPARYNAVTLEVKEALLAVLDELAAADGVRAAVLTGAGRGFCVGQDLAEHAAALRSDAGSALNTVAQHYNPIVSALVALPYPVIAAVHGPCVGAGLGLALACDLRVAAAGLRFATAFTGVGLGSDSGMAATLTAALGPSRAMELLLTGDTFTAEQALEWGLVREVVAPEDVLSTALVLARTLAEGPTLAYAEIKRMIRFATTAPLPDVLAAEADAQQRLSVSADHAGAVEAFLAKRRPTFHGR